MNNKNILQIIWNRITPHTLQYCDEDKLITIKDIPAKEDIKKVLKYANLRYNAIIKFMISSGMG